MSHHYIQKQINRQWNKYSPICLSASQKFGLKRASQAPKNDNSSCSSGEGECLHFCYFTVDVSFCLLFLMMISHDKWRVPCFSRCTACRCCRVIRSLKAAKVADNEKSLEIFDRVAVWPLRTGNEAGRDCWLQFKKTKTKKKLHTLNEILFWFPLACKMFIRGRLQPTELPLTLIRSTLNL